MFCNQKLLSHSLIIFRPINVFMKQLKLIFIVVTEGLLFIEGLTIKSHTFLYHCDQSIDKIYLVSRHFEKVIWHVSRCHTSGHSTDSTHSGLSWVFYGNYRHIWSLCTFEGEKASTTEIGSSKQGGADGSPSLSNNASNMSYPTRAEASEQLIDDLQYVAFAPLPGIS